MLLSKYWYSNRCGIKSTHYIKSFPSQYTDKHISKPLMSFGSLQGWISPTTDTQNMRITKNYNLTDTVISTSLIITYLLFWLCYLTTPSHCTTDDARNCLP